jgi:hypothetical protein
MIITRLERKQTTPPLTQGVNNQSSQEQANSNTNSNLNDRKSNVKRNAVDGITSADVCSANRSSVRCAVADDLIG